MVKLNELPPEIVDVITEHSYDVKYIDVEQNYPHLLSFAVLSPAFRRASQDLLNRKVFISTRRAASLWLEERLECPVKELIIRACGTTLDSVVPNGGNYDAAFLRERKQKARGARPEYKLDPRLTQHPLSFIPRDNISTSWARTICTMQGSSNPFSNAVSTPFANLTLRFTDKQRRNRTAFDLRSVGAYVKRFEIDDRAPLHPRDLQWGHVVEWTSFTPQFAHLKVIEHLLLPVDDYPTLHSIVKLIPNPTIHRFSFHLSYPFLVNDPHPLAEIEDIIALPQMKNLSVIEVRGYGTGVELARDATGPVGQLMGWLQKKRDAGFGIVTVGFASPRATGFGDLTIERTVPRARPSVVSSSLGGWTGWSNALTNMCCDFWRCLN